MMEVREAIYKRQSIRKYKEGEIPEEDVLKILDAARVAPSGDNSQNWHFVVVRTQEVKEKIGEAILKKNEEIALVMDPKDPEKGLRFRKFVKNFTLFILRAPLLIVVFAEKTYPTGYKEYVFAEYPQEAIDALYRRDPGMQNVGAAVENMTLTAVDLGYGSCWLTSPNYAADEVEAALKEATGFEKEGFFLSCMLSVGIPEEGARSPQKKSLEEICTFV